MAQRVIFRLTVTTRERWDTQTIRKFAELGGNLDWFISRDRGALGGNLTNREIGALLRILHEGECEVESISHI